MSKRQELISQSYQYFAKWQEERQKADKFWRMTPRGTRALFVTSDEIREFIDISQKVEEYWKRHIELLREALACEERKS